MSATPYKLTLRAVLLFEKLTARSFSSLSILNEEDAVTLLYCLQRCEEGGSLLPIDVWKQVLESESVKGELYARLERTLEAMIPLSPPEGTSPSKETDEDTSPDFTSIAGMLVVDGGLSPSYVMDTMELWEIPAFLDALDRKKREALEHQRLFTWMTMMPHLSSDSVGSPEELLPFPWEQAESNARKKHLFDFLASADIRES
jgi:hypothetical protein|uniref:Uncharacterized protein n=1 Tax=Siphoviridae sp. ctoic9 TaxID=2825671 RepID=A0A8S5Q9Z0_9CAUD|nr:MAG TPA: hypothetical protein [Siphoviridae sp. ctoic9]